MTEPLLELANLTMRFGGVTALDTVTLNVDRGEIFGLIGPNGAGKTTVFNVVTGVFEPTNGEVRFTGKSIAGLSRNEITRLGIARTFQNIRLFREMTALENVMVGADAHHRTSVPGAIIRFGRHRAEEADGHERGMQLLEFMGIARRCGRGRPQPALRRPAPARDRPGAGDQAAAAAARRARRRLQPGREAGAHGPHPAGSGNEGYTVLLIEHDMSLVMGISDRINVLDFGRMIAEGTPAEVRENPAVIEAYLGAPRCFLRSRTARPLRTHRGDQGLVVHRRRRRDRHAHRRQRRGQDDDPEGDLRRSSVVGRHDHRSTAATSPEWPRTSGSQLGICQAPEGRGIFPGMTVTENLEMGTYIRKDRKSAAKEADLERVFSLFPRLLERRTQAGGTLSGGEQQMLAIGRALMARPRVLLLDEPSMGLAPMLVAQIFSIITEINQQGTTILLVEQNAAQALQRAHRAYVLETGRIVRTDDAKVLLGDDSVRAAYLGGDVEG